MISTDNSLLEASAAAYNLKNIHSVSTIESWGDTVRWLILLDSGEKLFFKEKVFYLSDEEFINKINFHKFMQDNNGPVTNLKPTINNSLFFKFEEKYFELQQWKDGDSININKESETYLLGQALANFDKTAHGCSINTSKDIWSWPQARPTFFPDHPSIITSYCRILNKTCERLFASQELSLCIEEKLQELISKVFWSKLPLAWIHGDASPDNSIRLRNSDTIVLIDLDNIRKGYRLWDLARTLAISGAFEFESIKVKNVRNEWNLLPIKNIIEGFHSISKMNIPEFRSLLPCIGINLITAFISEYDLDDEEYGICEQNDLPKNIKRLEDLLNTLDDININYEHL